MRLITLIYKSLVGLRNLLYDKGFLSSYRSSIPVISVGNLTVGGTGKTPFVIYIANFLKEKNLNPLIVTRGYKRASSKQILITKGSNHRLADIGDEAAVLHSSCPGIDIVVNKDRVAAAKWAEKQPSKYSCIILDDGFQHRAITRDYNILLINPAQDMSGFPPFGKLREPFRNRRRADVVVFTKEDPSSFALEKITKLNIPVYNAYFSFFSEPLFDVRAKKKSLAFCGLENPDFFYNSLMKMGINYQEKLTFKDHQNYSSSVIASIVKAMKKHNIKAFVTTHKDWVKLPKSFIEDYEGYCINMSVAASCGTSDESFKKAILSKVKK